MSHVARDDINIPAPPDFLFSMCLWHLNALLSSRFTCYLSFVILADIP